jgi:hypothetical protein
MAESRKQQQQNSRFCCGLRPRHVGLRATLPGLTGQTDPHGQLTADEMGILPSTYGVPFTGGSSLRGHAIGGERYVVPFGGGGSGAASAAPRWPQRVEPRGWRQATRRSAREDDDKSRCWRNSRLSRPVRVRAFAADPIESPGRSVAGGRPARVLLRSVPASRQQGVHRTLLQSKHGVSRRRQQCRVKLPLQCSKSGGAPCTGLGRWRGFTVRHACAISCVDRGRSLVTLHLPSPALRAYAYPCHPMTHASALARPRLGKSGRTW